jgi:hypothetical protein
MKHMRQSALLVLVISLAGCAGSGTQRISSNTDELTGVSLTRPQKPLEMAAVRPGLSDVGKDYLYSSPVTVSGIGAPQTWLWFGVGSSVDRKLGGTPVPEWKAIYLLVDGTAMSFDLVPWTGVTSSLPYALPVRLYAEYATRVTSSQVRQIANAESIEAYVTNADDQSPVFVHVAGDTLAWLDVCCASSLSAQSSFD